jgi:dolichyl-phosphate beta-glucosyltransferase
MNKISLIIPVYNEEKRIKLTLSKCISYFKNKKIDYEIIIVDDGSTDKTRLIIKDYLSENKNIKLTKQRKNKGKGYSVKEGMLLANGDYLLFSDADLSTPIEEIEKFIKVMKKGYDIVIASRNMKDSIIPIKQPFFRKFLGQVFPLIVNLLILPGYKDTQCGFKLFKKEVAIKIFSKQKINDFGFDVEILFIAKKYGYKIKEIPVIWSNSLVSKVSPLLDSIRMFLDILKIRLNDIKNTYN